MTDFPLPPSGRIAGPLHRYAVRAFYEDTDLSGVVYHANYVKWFERARSDMLRLLGIDQRGAVEMGQGAYVVAEMQIRWASPARLDDVVQITTSAEEVSAASAWLIQRAFRQDLLLAEARVRVGFVSPEGRPRRQPASWRTAFTAFAKGEFEPKAATTGTITLTGTP
jgi:acyl-CoA thioester hydrolase